MPSYRRRFFYQWRARVAVFHVHARTPRDYAPPRTRGIVRRRGTSCQPDTRSRGKPRAWTQYGRVPGQRTVPRGSVTPPWNRRDAKEHQPRPSLVSPLCFLRARLASPLSTPKFGTLNSPEDATPGSRLVISLTGTVSIHLTVGNTSETERLTRCCHQANLSPSMELARLTRRDIWPART